MKEDDRPEDAIEVPDAPPVPGLTFRRYRGDEDIPRFHAVFEATKETDGISWTETLEDFQNEYAHLTNTDVERDIVAVEVDGQMIVYYRQYWVRELDGTYSYRAFEALLPTWRGMGIRRTMLTMIERRAREVAKGHTDATKKMITTWTWPGDEPRQEALEEHGFTPLRYFFEMLRDLREPIEDSPLPEGIEVRPVPPEDYRKVFDAANEALKDHWGAREWTDVDYDQFLNDPTFTPDLWIIGYDGDEVAGNVVNWINEAENKEFQRKWGYTEIISVRRPYRGKGLAKALVTRSMVRLRDLGMEHANLGVDSENPSGAMGLYTGLGYKPIKTWTVLHKDLED